MALDKPIEQYIPGIPSGQTVTATDVRVTTATIAATVAGAAGATLQAVLEDLAGRVVTTTTIEAEVDGATGATLQAVLEDLADRVTALEALAE